MFDLQSQKFPFSLPYIAASFLSVSAFIFFYDLQKSNVILEYLGRNAIFYYAGQGVSSSVLMFVQPFIHFPWFLKLIVMLCFNLFLSFIFSEILRLIYQFISDFSLLRYKDRIICYKDKFRE